MSAKGMARPAHVPGAKHTRVVPILTSIDFCQRIQQYVLNCAESQLHASRGGGHAVFPCGGLFIAQIAS
jgi:hypothetical protein